MASNVTISPEQQACPSSFQAAAPPILSRKGADITICHIITRFYGKAMTTRRTLLILTALLQQGYRVLLIAGVGYRPEPEWDLSGIEIFQVPELMRAVSPLEDLTALWRIYAILKKQRPHVVHTHLAKAGVLGRMAARLARVPHIIHTVHGPSFPKILPAWRRRPFWLLEKICAGFTDHFIFVGEELLQEYLQTGICRRRPISVIRTGRAAQELAAADAIDSLKLAELRTAIVKDKDKDAFLIGCVARLIPAKRQEMGIQSVRLLRQKGINAHVVFAGLPDPADKDGYLEKLTSLAETLGVSPYVHFVGFREDILAFTKAMDVLIMTSLYEGLPNVAVEAAIVGRPMVAFEVCGIREIIIDGQTGYLLPQGDLQELVERLLYLARNPSARLLMGDRASNNIRLLHNQGRMIKEKLSLYDKILNINNKNF